MSNRFLGVKGHRLTFALRQAVEASEKGLQEKVVVARLRQKSQISGRFLRLKGRKHALEAAGSAPLVDGFRKDSQVVRRYHIQHLLLRLEDNRKSVSISIHNTSNDRLHFFRAFLCIIKAKFKKLTE